MVKEIPKSILFAVYGTLKRNKGNHARIQGNGVTFKGEFKTEPRFTMYSLGGFPAVCCNGSTAITTELYEVTNPYVIEGVFALERYTGKQNSDLNWYDVEHIDTPHGKASMFIFKNAPKTSPVVENGIW